MGERIRGGRATARALVLVVALLVTATAVAPDRAAAQPAPATITVSMTPATDLVDNMVVTVTGHGFAPDRVVGAAQCLGNPTVLDTGRCQGRSAMLGVSDQNGDVTMRLVLDAVLYLPFLGGWIPRDCRTLPCSIWIADLSDPADLSRAAGVPLPYVPGSPNLPGELTVTPAGGLVDGQHVTIAGRLFPGGGNVAVHQCATGASGTQRCESRGQRPVPILPDGTFTLPFRIDALLTFGVSDRETVDCRTAAGCVIRVDDSFDDGTEPDAFHPLDFAPDGPLAPPFPATVAPTTDLVDGQDVTTTISGLEPGESVFVDQCATADPAEERCDSIGGGSANAQGRFSRALPVSVALGPITDPSDCRTDAPPCVVRFTSIPEHRTTVVELHFDPEGPGPPPTPPPTVTVDPATGIDDGDDLQIETTSVPVLARLEVALCSADGLHCDRPYVSQINNTTSPALIQVVGLFEATDGEVVDCRAAPGCRVFSRTATFTVQSEVLGFAPQEPVRYLDPIVTGVEVTPDLVYRHTVDRGGNPVDLALDIYEPAGDTATDRPVVVWLPGGWFRSVDRSGRTDARMARNLARRGYVVAVMDYRTLGEPGTGFPDFATSVAAAADAYDDVTAGIGWLAERAGDLGIDPDRVVATGIDAGGVTAFDLAHVPGQRGPATSVVAAAVPLAGLSLGVPEPGEPPVQAFHGIDDPDIAVGAAQRSCDNAFTAGLVCRVRVLPGGADVLPAFEHLVAHEATRFLAEAGVVTPGGS